MCAHCRQGGEQRNLLRHPSQCTFPCSDVPYSSASQFCPKLGAAWGRETPEKCQVNNKFHCLTPPPTPQMNKQAKPTRHGICEPPACQQITLLLISPAAMCQTTVALSQSPCWESPSAAWAGSAAAGTPAGRAVSAAPHFLPLNIVHRE